MSAEGQSSAVLFCTEQCMTLRHTNKSCLYRCEEKDQRGSDKNGSFFDHCISVFESKTTLLSEIKAEIQSCPALLPV